MNKRYKILFILLIAVFASLIVINFALAQVNVGVGYGQNIGLSNKDPRDIVVSIIQVALGFLGILAVIIILYAGFRWMTSGGDPAKIDRAKKILISGIIGLLIILASWGITAWLMRGLGGAITGTSCTVGDTQACNACTGAGFRTCVAPNTWGPCSTACNNIGDVCCSGVCQPPPCNINPNNNCDANPLTPGVCELDQPHCDSVYGVGNSVCDPTIGCQCRLLGTYGDPCDQDTSLPTCDIPDDTMCAAWLNCDTTTCTCVGGPVIQWLSPVDTAGTPVGTQGNLITIGGNYFGAYGPNSQVIFGGTDSNSDSDAFNDGNEIIAPFPDTVNPACVNTWTDTQVIVVVPTGAVDGPIRIIRDDLSQDDTDDARGPIFNDFLDDGITRPGSCQVNPASGYFDDAFTMNGINYNGTTQSIQFGNQTGSVAANNINFVSNLTANATVPNIRAVNTTIFVDVDGVSSNYLSFQVLFDWANAPFISYIDPATGTPEQYITIYGGNFKSYLLGVSNVTMTGQASGNNYFADGLSFPPECQDSWWKDKQIVVKVPQGIPVDFYDVTVTNRTPATSAPEIFEVRAGTPGPGLCKLDPDNGPINRPVSLYGDNFSPAPGFVRFFNNVTINIFNPGDWTNQNINTSVPAGAQTGPVRVSNGSRLSNSLQFRVGSCTTDSECNAGESCCGPGTAWNGICRPPADCIATGPALAEFGWTFTTTGGGPVVGTPCYNLSTDQGHCDTSITEDCTSAGLVCDPFLCTCQRPCYIDPIQTPSCTPLFPPDDCSAYGQVCDPSRCICVNSIVTSCTAYDLGTCALNQFCPNSPGECSPYAGGNPEILSNACSDAECVSRFGAGYTYNNNLDHCVETGSTCDLPQANFVNDVFGNPLTAYCADYGGAGTWHVSTRASCPTGWINIGNDSCIIGVGANCTLCTASLNCFDDGSGAGICAIGADICPGLSTCNASGQCETIDSPTCECCCEIGQDARDCCAPLQCIGDCGTDAQPGPDTDTFGHCSGCRIESGGTVDYAASDAACNCLNSSGKYCDVNADADNDGTPDGICRDCSQIGVDEPLCDLHAGVCCTDRQASDQCRGGDGTLIPGLLGDCAYYDCDAVTPTLCDTLNPDPYAPYRDILTCTNICAAGPPTPPGQRCQSLNFPACTTGGICSNPYDCIDEAGADCRCCCDPANDLCPAPLSCYADQGSCTGPTRGLCCGCTTDSQCSGGIDGCGNDTCCHPRPFVSPGSEIPADGDTGTCLNPLIQADFNEPMDIGSFAGNFILIGDYGANPCPDGTQFLVRLDPNRPRGIAQVFNTIITFLKRIISGNPHLAQAQFGSNFCAIPGTTSGYNSASGQGVINFSPSRVLEPMTDYYAIIKGDTDLTDAIAEGVRSAFGISMNSPLAPPRTFNAVTYTNAHIWSFTTGDEICKLSSVEVEPASYLFNTTANDSSDDNITSAAFDTVFDRDKAFFAYAYSSNGQPVAPIPGSYDWSWSWTSDNQSIAQVAILSSGASSTAMVTAQKQEDARTFIRANASITVDTVNNPPTLGQIKSGRATVYVFMCGNPWPPRAANGNWSPWMDSANNCTIIAGGCGLNNNFEIYYCRDSGKTGTADDLPSIASSTVIRGSSLLTNILKEFYFLRDTIPQVATSTILATDQMTGTSVLAQWTHTLSGISGYKLYWGQRSRSYNQSADISLSGNTTYPNLNCWLDSTVSPPIMNCLVGGLKTGATYYFAYTAYYATQAESPYSREDSAIPTDSTPPSIPAGLSATSSDSEVRLDWTRNTDDTISYRLYYGVASGVYGSVQDLGNVSSVIISGLNNGTTYYFTLSAIDAYNNESATTTEVSAIPTP